MAEDSKIVSLEERRKAASRGAARRSSQPAPGQTPDNSGARTGSDGKPTPTPAEDLKPLPGQLVWLYCPTCRTIEYTEMQLAGGRTHNVCGTQVHEAVVDLDLRAEATVAQINLERLQMLQSLLDGQRQRYEEYLHRVQLAAGKPVAPYSVDADPASALPEALSVSGVDAFGLLVSHFFDDPAQRFPELAAESTERESTPTDPDPKKD